MANVQDCQCIKLSSFGGDSVSRKLSFSICANQSGGWGGDGGNLVLRTVVRIEICGSTATFTHVGVTNAEV